MSFNEDDDCKSYLINNSNSLEDKTKFDLFEKCMNKDYDISEYLEKKDFEQHKKNINYEMKKLILKEYNEKKDTFDEELINNKNTINFTIIENRIIFATLLLLIFLIYKYILK